MALLRDFFKSPSSETVLRSDFDTIANAELCDVNIEAKLKAEEWEISFRLLYSVSCYGEIRT